MRNGSRAPSKLINQSILCAITITQSIFHTSGCTANADIDDLPLENAAQVSVQSSPSLKYRLSDFSYEVDPGSNKRMMKWTSASKRQMFGIEPRLTEGTSSLENSAFVQDGLVPDREPDFMYQTCSGNCRGSSTVSIQIARRKLVFDMEINFNIEIPACSTRYCVDVPADQSNIYTKCNIGSPCSSPFFGCECKRVIPCKGNVAKSADELCPNPDFRKVSVPVSIRANAALSEADL